jgi:beta-N-acetylglucosaminidase
MEGLIKSIMIKLKKICFSLLSIFVIFTSVAPSSLAEMSTSQEFQIGIVSNSEQEGLSNMYKEPSDTSEVLIEVPNDSEVRILKSEEELSPYSLAVYYDLNTETEIQGYILTEHITLQESPDPIEDSPVNETDTALQDEVQSPEKEDKTSDETESSEEELETEEEPSNEEKTRTEAPEAKVTNEFSEKSFTSLAAQPVSGEVLYGVALKSPTIVYKETSQSSQKLKVYEQGKILKYQALNSQWYIATVYVNGKASSGYIYKSDVENIAENQVKMKGVGLQSPTNIYTYASENSTVLKSYSQGSILYYKMLISGWYECTVYLDGKATTGYIKATDVENVGPDQTSIKGVAKGDPTPIYSSASTSAKKIKSYSVGSILVYKTFISGWYECTVYVNGKATTGYIKATDVENVLEQQKSLKGVAKQTSTNIYLNASSTSTILKSYPLGSVLVYKTFANGWYECTVYVNGKATTGYINANDVENAVEKPVSITGIAVQSATPIYRDASTSSSILKSYSKGTVLVYKTFINGWYECTVYLNGKATKGYINASDVEDGTQSPVSYKGVGLQSPTYIFSDASTSSEVIKSYSQGTLLTYKSFVGGWYECVVYVNGHKQTGYIHASHVENVFDQQDELKGISLQSPTYIYSKASQLSTKLKQYDKGTILTFKTFTTNWYECTVYINGQATTGYIYVNDVKSLGTDVIQTSTDYGLTFEEMVDKQMAYNPQTDLYRNEPAYIYADYVDMEKGIVTDDRVNVRSSPTTTTSDNIVQQLYTGDGVYVIGKQGDWVEVRITWKKAKEEDVRYYLDPDNFSFGTPEYYQFLKLSMPANLSAAEVNEKVLAGKGILDGKAQAFIDAANTFKVNEVYLISHALLETGNGGSTLANGVVYNGVKVYNMYGYGARDACPLECGAQTAYDYGWFTPEEAIIGGAKLISQGYIYRDGFQQDTLYKMRWNPEEAHQYATDIGWAYKQVNSIYNIYQLLDNYTLYFDKPYYSSTK